MGSRLVNVIKDTGLEKGGRHVILEALAEYANDSTYVARASAATLAVKARCSIDTAARVLKKLEGDGLITVLKAVSRGRGTAGSAGHYKINMARLAPVAAATRQAESGIYAGAAKAIIRSNLSGATATFKNGFGVIVAMWKAVDHERERAETFGEVRRTRELRAHAAAILTQYEVLKSVAAHELGTAKAAQIEGYDALDAEFSEEESAGNSAQMSELSSKKFRHLPQENADNSDGQSVNSDICHEPPTPPIRNIPKETLTRAPRTREAAKSDLRAPRPWIRRLIDASGRSKNLTRYLEGSLCYVDRSTLIIAAASVFCRDRLSTDLKADMSALALAAGCEGYRVEVR